MAPHHDGPHDDAAHTNSLDDSPHAKMHLSWAASRRRRRLRSPTGRVARLCLRPQWLLVFIAAVAILALYIVSFYARALVWGMDPVASVQRDVFRFVRHARPTCRWRTWQHQRFAPLLAANRTVFLAANFYNSERVLPTVLQELPVVLDYFGPQNVFVSVYENGSTDRTRALLMLLRDMLTVHGTPHAVVSDAENAAVSHAAPAQQRIAWLAAVRNRALAPLYSGAAAARMPRAAFDDVLFLNDVVFCAQDLLELAHQKLGQGANQVCATDWGDPVVYDRWVLRAQSGRSFYRYEDLVKFFNAHEDTVPPVLPLDAADRARFRAHAPLQVFSCWNGATMLDAAPFVAGPDPVRFRVSRADRDDTGLPRNATNKASECFLASVDLWRKGRGKIMLVPRASVAYQLDHYETYRKDRVRPLAAEEEQIAWDPQPPREVAMQDYGEWDVPERWAPWDEQ